MSLSSSQPLASHEDSARLPLDAADIGGSSGRAAIIWRRFRGDPLALGALSVLGILILVALTAPLISIYVTHATPDKQNLLRALRPPGAPYLLGTDELGRDVLTRMVYGARVSLSVSAMTVLVALSLGAFLGAAAGYYGGLGDVVIMRIVDVLQSIPSLFILIMISVIFNVGVVSLALVIASLSWTGVSRLVRGEVLSLRERDFVVAARALGQSDFQIILRHILPNVVPTLIVWATLSVGNVILVEASLSYLGLGIQPPAPSWGNMLSNSQQYFFRSSTLVIIPGVAILLTVLSINVVGNALRDGLDPHLGRH